MSAKIRFPKDTERLGLGDLKVGDIIKPTNSKGIWQVTTVGVGESTEVRYRKFVFSNYALVSADYGREDSCDISECWKLTAEYLDTVLRNTVERIQALRAILEEKGQV